jgi:hypothetical protein
MSNTLPKDYGTMNIQRALRERGVVPNSTWIRSDGAEMLVVMPNDEEAIRDACDEFVCMYTYPGSIDEAPQWIRVVRMGVGQRSHACVDIVYVPFMCGQIDAGVITRVG